MIMVNVINNDTNILLEVYGHAEYAEHGKDIVCAAVSTLTQTYANALVKRNLLSKVIMDSGYMYISAHRSYESELLFDMMIDGIASVKEQYEKNICININ